MSKPEIKVGQKYRVVDALGFGYSDGRAEVGDTLEVTERQSVFSNHYVKNLTREAVNEILIYPEDVAEGYLELIEDVQEPTEHSEDDSPVWATSIPESVETRAWEATGTPESIIEAADRVLSVKHENCDDQEPIKFYKNKPTDIQSGLSAELLWKFIEGSSEYNQHKQFEVDELPWDVLKDTVKTLGEYLENDEDTLATSLEIRLMYNGNLSEKFKHTWGASVYQLDYWEDGEHKDDHRDRLLFGVEIVRGI